jgi:hypothetical protein
MTIISTPATAGHSIDGTLVGLRAWVRRWRRAREQRIADATNVADKPAPTANVDRTEVGPMLAVYLPYWGRSAVNEARERRS